MKPWWLALIPIVVGGCTVFDEEINPKTPPPDCVTNAECTERLTAGGATVPAACVQTPEPHCAQLTSVDCTTITGDYLDDRAVIIASLLSTTGAQAATNLPRQQAAIMAVEEINATNASGGIIQSQTPGDARKLVMVSCDEVANLPRVATHLLAELYVPAIVGPNLSQDVLDLTAGNPATGLLSSAQAGTALLSPTAVASAIATIPDNGLTYMMVPSDIQRVPLMKNRIGAVEAALKIARSKTTIKLGIYYRNDALGQGTVDGLTSLMLNGGTLANAINLGKAREDAYDAVSTDNSALVASYLQFQPDIIVVVGAAESVKYFVTPLEAAWQSSIPAVPKPYYIGIDSTKVQDLVSAVTGNDEYRRRWSGTGVTPTPDTQAVFSAFQIAYGQRWKDAMGNPQPATQSGMGPAYDAVYTIALALVGTTEVRGNTLVANMPNLATNASQCTYDASGVQPPCFSLSDNTRTLYQNMAMILGKRPVTELATFGRLEWDAQGAKTNGLIEIWCINGAGPKPLFSSSGLTYDVKSQSTAGAYVECGP
jgi:ABC-type branched-subunit amino acid transport system substrate-binding protein